MSMFHRPRDAHGAVHRQRPAFPRRVEHRLVGLRLDRAEAVHAAHVVYAVHFAGSFATLFATLFAAWAGVSARPVPIMALRVTRLASFSSLQPSVPGGPHRHHDEAGLGGGVPHPDLGLGRQGDAEVGKHAARIDHRARAIGRRLVPHRRQPQHFPGVAGAQRADDHVVALRRVLDRDQMDGAPGKAERADRVGGVGDEAALELRIGPGLGDDAGADMRPDLGLVGVDDEVERLGIDIALLGQDRLRGPAPGAASRRARSRGHGRGRGCADAGSWDQF